MQFRPSTKLDHTHTYTQTQTQTQRDMERHRDTKKRVDTRPAMGSQLLLTKDKVEQKTRLILKSCKITHPKQACCRSAGNEKGNDPYKPSLLVVSFKGTKAWVHSHQKVLSTSRQPSTRLITSHPGCLRSRNVKRSPATCLPRLRRRSSSFAPDRQVAQLKRHRKDSTCRALLAASSLQRWRERLVSRLNRFIKPTSDMIRQNRPNKEN